HFLVAGQSYGGYLARGIACKKRERVDGMALICPMIIADRDNRDLPERTVIAKDEALLATLSPEEKDGFTSMSVVQD
ncbi:alpha/beta hydrolase, partial [Frankia sp. Cpl3]|nr:alpha/beta hydrolase [Frankia sp. Cpl3]